MSACADPFFEEGYQDYYDCVTKEECPHDEGSDARAGWLRGWTEADEE